MRSSIQLCFSCLILVGAGCAQNDEKEGTAPAGAFLAFDDLARHGAQKVILPEDLESELEAAYELYASPRGMAFNDASALLEGTDHCIQESLNKMLVQAEGDTVEMGGTFSLGHWALFE
jgi:hypothetical protein